MSDRWNQSGFPVDNESQYPQDTIPHSASSVPYSSSQLHDYDGSSSSSYPVGGAMSFRQVGESNFHLGDTDGLSQAGHHTDHLAVVPGFGYSQNTSDGPNTTSYGLVRRSQMEYYEHNLSTGSSSHNHRVDSNYPTSQSFQPATYSADSPSNYAPQYHDATGPSHIPAGTAWPSSNSGYRYDATTYHLSTTNDSAESVPDSIGQSRVFKRVVATGGVVDASMRRRHPARPGRLYKCTGFPPCQATFTSSHNLKNHIDSHLGNRQHQCSYCPTRTVTLSDIKRHEKTCKNRPSTITPGPS